MVNLINGSVNYTYDKLNQLTLESGTIDAQSFSLANTYDMLGNRLSLNEDNLATNYTYNSLNQLTQSSGSTQKLIQVKGNVSDANPVTVKVNGINAIISLGQFTANNVPLNSGLNAIKAEATDSAGNINSHQINVTYNPTNPTITYTYDKNGNLIQRKVNTTTETFTYDYENRLKTYSSPTQSATYTYNGLGKRVSKTVNGTTTQYYYDGDEVISEKTVSSSIYYIHTNRIDEIISDSRGYSYQYDGLGSVVNLTDASGVKVASYNYKAFGDMRSQSGAVSNAWLFTGRQFDSESGLYNYRNRYYAPAIGRFITQDPSLRFGARPVIPYLLLTHLNDPRQLHSYLYCINSPVNWVDPFGLNPWGDVHSFTVFYTQGPDAWARTFGNRTSWNDLVNAAGEAAEIMGKVYESYQILRDSTPPGTSWTSNPAYDKAIDTFNLMTDAIEKAVEEIKNAITDR